MATQDCRESRSDGPLCRAMPRRCVSLENRPLARADPRRTRGPSPEDTPTSRKTPPAEPVAPAMARNDCAAVHPNNRNCSAAARSGVGAHSVGSGISGQPFHVPPSGPSCDLVHCCLIRSQVLPQTRLFRMTVATTGGRLQPPAGGAFHQHSPRDLSFGNPGKDKRGQCSEEDMAFPV